MIHARIKIQMSRFDPNQVGAGVAQLKEIENIVTSESDDELEMMRAIQGLIELFITELKDGTRVQQH